MNEPTPTPAEPAPISAVDAIYGPKPQAAAPEPAAPEPAVQEPVADPAEPPVVAADPAADPAAEEVEIHALTELAEHFELDPEWLKTLKITDKVRGEAVEFSIADALETHRKVQAGDSYLTEAKGKAKTLIEEATQQKQSWATGIATVNELIVELETDLKREAAAVLTPALKDSDPAMYVLRQNELRDRQERVAGIKQRAQQGIQQAVQKTQAEQAAAFQKLREQRLPHEREALLERVPEWSDEAKATAEQKEVVAYLTREGFTQQDLVAFDNNARLLAMAVKAMRADSGKAKLETIKKKVVKIPKVLKPGPKPAAAKPNGADKSDPVSILYGP